VASSPTAPSSLSSLRAVLFDADHTLLDTSKAERCALRAALRGRSLPCPPSTLDAYRAINGTLWARYSRGEIDAASLSRERFRRLLAHLEGDVEDGAALSEAYIEGISGRGDLLPACRASLGRLKRRYRLGLVTNGLDRVQRSRLRAARLEGFFEVVVTSESCGFAKPDPRILGVALDALGVSAAQAMYVGDDLRTDGAAARAAGVAFVWMDRSGLTVSGAETDGPRVSTLRELVELLGADGMPRPPRSGDYNHGGPMERKRWTPPS
jgi:YjjG family noncanonical pyrimidine nucleotidase